MKKVKAIFFDAGNTILYLNFKLIRKVIGEFGYKVSITDLKESELNWRPRLESELHEVKELPDKEILPHYFQEILGSIDIPDEDKDAIVDEIIARHRKKMIWSNFPSSVYKLLKDLQDRGYKLGVISNSDGRLYNHLKSMKIVDLFDAVIDSREVGYEKPDPRIFEEGLRRLKSTPEESIYVGDIYSIDIIPAQKLGMTAILFDPGDNFSHLHCPRITRLKDINKYLDK